MPVACVHILGLLEVIRLHRFHVHLCFFPLSSTGAGADASAVASSGFRNHLSLFLSTAHILSSLLFCFIMCFNAYLRFSLNLSSCLLYAHAVRIPRTVKMTKGQDRRILLDHLGAPSLLMKILFDFSPLGGINFPLSSLLTFLDGHCAMVGNVHIGKEGLPV